MWFFRKICSKRFANFLVWYILVACTKQCSVDLVSRRGGIGRRARFRSVFREEWGFDSLRRYHLQFKDVNRLQDFTIFCGYGITAVHQPSKLDIRVRLPLPAPVAKLIKIYQTIFNVAGFPSGQRGQTVNLLAMLSVVRIHLQPPFFLIKLLITKVVSRFFL